VKPFPLNKADIPVEDFWKMSPERRSQIVLLGVFLNETNWLMRLLVKAAHGVQDTPPSRLTPEEEVSEAVTALLATTLVGKVFESWKCLIRGERDNNSILEKLPLSDRTKQLRDVVRKNVMSKLFRDIRNHLGFHYVAEEINIDRLKGVITDRDSHIFIHPQGYIGFTLSRLSTFAILEGIVGKNSAKNRIQAFEDTIAKILETTGPYSEFLSGALIDVIQNEFGKRKLGGKKLSIQGAPTDEEEGPLRFFTHPPQEFAPKQ
jgi:hypothetical protein